jgi:hypothetical protein
MKILDKLDQPIMGMAVDLSLIKDSFKSKCKFPCIPHFYNLNEILIFD